MIERLKPGIYLICWKSGGHSLASVGLDAQGQNWFAPCNWLTVPSYDWQRVERTIELQQPVTLWFEGGSSEG